MLQDNLIIAGQVQIDFDSIGDWQAAGFTNGKESVFREFSGITSMSNY